MANNKMSQGERLGAERIAPLLASLAIPAVAAQIVNVLYNMVDRIYIGHIPEIGAQALTGVGVCMPVILMISAFAALAGMGGAPRASISMGRGKQREAEQILGNCTAMLLLVSVLLTGLILGLGRPMLFLFGASEDTISYAWDYMSIYAMGTVFVQAALGLNAFVTAQGFAKVSMGTVLIGAVCNILLDYIFIFKLGMGVQGAALATIISQGLSAAWVLSFLLGKKAVIKIKLKYLQLIPEIILPCLALGLSPFIMQITESILVVCFNSSLQHYGGDLAVGAMTILTTIRQLALLPLQGLTQGAQPIISYNYGAGRSDRMKTAFLLTLGIGLGYTGLLWGISMLAPMVLISLFTKEAALAEMTVWAIRIYMAVAFTMGVQTTCQQAFIAVGNAGTSIFLALFRKVLLLIPLIYILPLFFSNKIFGIYLAEPIADFAAMLMTLTMFVFQFKKVLKNNS